MENATLQFDPELLKDLLDPQASADARRVVVSTRDIRKTIHISSAYTVALRPIVSGGRESHRSIYTPCRKLTRRVEIEGLPFRTADTELALLDSLLVHTGREEIDRPLIVKFLKKHAKYLRRDVIGQLVSMRYITAVNRLREIAYDTGDEKLYRLCVDVIRVEGAGCFVTDREK